jgi:hypothetical protein
MELQPVAADAGESLLCLFIEQLGQTMNGVVDAASLAAQKHFPSGSLEIKIRSTLRAMDVCFCHISVLSLTLPQPLPSREGRGAGAR